MTNTMAHVEELRHVAAMDSCSWDYAQKLMRSSADEIERLDADAAAVQAELESVKQERHQLRNELTAARLALGQLTNGYKFPAECCTIAREGLAGAADEPRASETPAPVCTCTPAKFEKTDWGGTISDGRIDPNCPTHWRQTLIQNDNSEKSAPEPDGVLTIQDGVLTVLRSVTTVSPNFRVTATVSEPNPHLPEEVRLDMNRRIVGCTCDYSPGGKPDPKCPISFPHAEVAWGKRRKHNDDSPLGTQIRAELALKSGGGQ